MSAVARFLRKLAWLLHRRRFRSELEEEMAFHRAQAEGELRADGMMAEPARYAASRRLGNRALIQDKSHDVVRFGLESALADLRYAIRQLSKNPSFTFVMLLTLALSMGANSAIFSVIDGVLLRALPYPRADRLVRVFLSSPTYPKFSLNPFDVRDFRARSRSFDGVALFTRGDVQLSQGNDAQRLNAFGITAGYFQVLGLAPELGREFDREAEIPGNGHQVILSDRLWRARFNADPAILGRKITLNLEPFTVVGVMPAGSDHPGNEYHAVPYGESVDVWWPFSFNGDPYRRGSHYTEAIARLKDGVSVAQAKAELNALMDQMQREHPGVDDGWTVLVIPLADEIVGRSRQLLWVLLGSVGLVMLIACANAANLLLVRASVRQREIAVRMAMGASRGRMLGQMLTESLLLSGAGGVLGLGLAICGVRGLVSILPADFPRAGDIHVSGPVFGFTFAVSAITGLLFGIAPGLEASRTDPKGGLQKGGRTATASGHQNRLRNALVVSEISLACVLLSGAGLMLRSLLNQLHLDPGFRAEHLLTASLSLPHEQYKTSPEVGRFYQQLVSDLGRLPGVESAGAGSDLPWTGWDENAGGFQIEGKKPPPGVDLHARYHMATPDYFRALGVPLLAGRFIKESDTATAPAVILINRAMADRYWPGEDAVGKRMTFSDHPQEKNWITVVGVVGDIKDQPNSPRAEPAFWWPELIAANRDMSIALRSRENPELLADALRNEVRHLNPGLAVAEVQVMDRIVDSSVATPRFAFVLVGLFAALAIVLAAIGVYGVLAFTVTQRTAEFGLRMALGAQKRDVLSLVLRQAALLTAAGAIIGVAGSVLLGRFLKSLIFAVSPTDPATLGAVGLAVVAVALAACLIPAHRATKADPMEALRAE